MKNESNWIGIGICHKDIIEKNNFFCEADKISNKGHGTYMISNNGGTWHNYSSEFNNKVKSFTFRKRDIV